MPLTFFDPGSGAVITNKYITNSGGISAMSPQSTSLDIFRIFEPASSSQNLFRITDSLGQNNFAIGNQTGLKAQLESSGVSPALLAIGYNGTAGYPNSGVTFGGIPFVTNGPSPSTGFAGMYATAAETQNVAALGTDLHLKTVATGAITSTNRVGLYANGDVGLNDSAVALATSATTGFTYLPTMAGQPTGTPTTRTATTAGATRASCACARAAASRSPGPCLRCITSRSRTSTATATST